MQIELSLHDYIDSRLASDPYNRASFSLFDTISLHCRFCSSVVPSLLERCLFDSEDQLPSVEI